MKRLWFVALITLAFLAGGALPAGADSEAVTYNYLIGTGDLCGVPAPNPCPTIARAANGDTIAITGTGSLTTHPKSVTGSGTFLHKDSAGVVIGGGTWTAIKLISFDGYGCGGEGLPANFCGGRAIIRVHLVASGGALEADGVLQVDCVIGDAIPAAAVEGIRLVVHSNVLGGVNFNQEVSGLTLFVD